MGRPFPFLKHRGILYRGAVSLALCFAITGLFGCVIGKHSEVKQPIDRLNGANYQAEGGATMLEDGPTLLLINGKYERQTILSGEVHLGSGLERVPAKFAVIEVLLESKKVAETTADSNGSFVVRALLKNGRYVLRAQIKGRSKDLPLLISKYENTGLVLEIP